VQSATPEDRRAAPEEEPPGGALPPALRRRLEAKAVPVEEARSLEEALALGELRLVDLEDPAAVPRGWTRRGAAELLPDPTPGRRDGAVETNLVRKGIFAAGHPSKGSSEQLMLRVLATRDRLGEIRRVDEDGPSLTEVEFQTACVICTAWRALETPLATTLPLTLGMICRELGWPTTGQRLHRVANALSALKRATFAGEIWDVAKGEMTFVHEFGLVQEWSAGTPNRPGQLGEVGFVAITNWLRRQLAGQHQTYYSRELMRALRRPSAKMLLPYLESERFDPAGPAGTRVKDWPVTEELFATIGIADSRPRQARRTLARAGEEIVERDERRRWLRIEVEPRGNGWRLVAERRNA
jgi:hypothetical protein